MLAELQYSFPDISHNNRPYNHQINYNNNKVHIYIRNKESGETVSLKGNHWAYNALCANCPLQTT